MSVTLHPKIKWNLSIKDPPKKIQVCVSQGNRSLCCKLVYGGFCALSRSQHQIDEEAHFDDDFPLTAFLSFSIFTIFLFKLTLLIYEKKLQQIYVFKNYKILLKLFTQFTDVNFFLSVKKKLLNQYISFVKKTLQELK